MKVISAKEMARIEKLSYADGASEEGFMNAAGVGIAEAIQRAVARYHLKPRITLLCGSGNNGGDAYVAGRILLEGGFHVHALAFTPFEKCSLLSQLQNRHFADAGGHITYIRDPQEISFGDSELLIDGLLGTGFHGEVEGLFKSAIEQANASQLPIIAIDIPSGINGTTGEIGSTSICARETVFLGLPKTGCFYAEAWNRVGRVHTFNFGLEARFIEQAHEDYFLIDDTHILDHLPKIERIRHKYQAGYVVGLAGSPGMPGAPTMSSFAALRAGAGIVRLFHPLEMSGELASAPPEVIREGYQKGNGVRILEEMKRASALFFGPGSGKGPESREILKQLLPHVDKPCVIDAEALQVFAESAFPPQSILTPHQGEMKKLLGIRDKNLPFAALLERSRNFARDKKVTLVLKGAPTYILHCDHKPYICAQGDPGMATAGSGDVLTGIIAGFLAQVGDPLQAALLGVQFHALAGAYAAEKWTSYCMVASDITAELPQVFKHYLELKAKYQSTKLESPLSSSVVG